MVRPHRVRRRGFADCFLFADITLVLLMSLAGMALIIIPIACFIGCWFGLYNGPTPDADLTAKTQLTPELITALVVALLAVLTIVASFFLTLGVELAAHPARLSCEWLCRDLEDKRWRSALRLRGLWLLGSLVVALPLFLQIPAANFPDHMSYGIALAGCWDFVLILGVTLASLGVLAARRTLQPAD